MMAVLILTKPPPLLQPVIVRFDVGGHPTVAQVQYEQLLQQWLMQLSSSTLPMLLPSYTVTTLPPAATYTAGLIYVSNGTANKRLAVSDGTNWRFPDGAIVS